MVKKANGKWRICIDYKDLNKPCPKDSFSLSKIDQLVDATSGHKLLSFIDTFSGYNQIQMAPKDEKNTVFVIHLSMQILKCFIISNPFACIDLRILNLLSSIHLHRS